MIYGNGTIDLNGDIVLSLTDITEYLPDQKDLQGRIMFSGGVKGSLASPEVEGSVIAEDLSYDAIRYGNLKGDIAYKEDLLKLTNLRSEVLDGRIEGGIEMDFRETPPAYHVVLKGEALRPYAIINRYRFGLQQQIREDGVVSAEIEARGQVPHDSKEMVRNNLEAKGWVSYKDEVQRLTFSGEIREGRHISLGITGELTDIARYVKIPCFSLHGAASLSGEISGTMDMPVINGVVMMSKGVVDDIAFDSITADLKLSEDTLYLQPVSFRRGEALYRIAGNIHFRSPGLKDPSFDLQAEINQGSPKDVVAIFYRRLPLDMKTDGRLKFTGDAADFSGTAELNVSEGSAYGQAFDNGHVAVTLTRDRVIFDSLKAERGRESVSGNGWIGFRGESRGAFHADISSGEFSIENIDLLTERTTLFKGTGTFKITGDGKVTDPVIEASVRIPRFFIKEADTGLAQISISKNGEKAMVAGEALSLRYEGHVVWDRAAPFSLTIHMEEGSIHPLLSLLRPSIAGEISASAAGEVLAEGRLADLSTLQIKAVLPQVTGLYGDYRVENDGDIRLSYAENRLTFDSVRFKGEGTALGIIGNLAPHGDVNIFVNGEADLRLLTLLTPEIKYSKGKAFVAFLISGGMENPSIQGGLAVKDGTIRSATLRQTLEGTNISLFFNGREIVLESMTGMVGGGAVNGSGKVAIEGFDVKEFGFALEVSDALFRYPEGLETRIDGTLLFQGTPRSKSLKGEIRIKKAAYEKNLNLRAMVLELQRKRVKLEQPVPFFGSTDLNIHIGGKKDIWINNNLAKLPVEVDLVLKGTIDHPLLFGRIEADDGTFVFSRNPFKVISATADFISPDTIRPVMDIHSTTEVRGYHIDLRLSGTIERFNLSLSSEPPLSETDILSLLTVGQTAAEAAETMKEVGTVEATAFLAAPIQEKIEGTLQDMLKIDRFQVDPYYSSSTASEGARLTVGKRLLDERLYVTYTTGITTIEELIKLEYFLGKNVYVVGERDEQGRMSGDVKFRFEFR
ncbi:MAG: translocation/assembly module TamB [Nitrospirae bacterium]|nr:translocation/assembly module TamB [Nitrospirota bacterium]